MSGSHLSKDFFDLVKSIGESRSKQEEDKIVIHEVATLKQKMAAKDVPPRKMREYLIRMIYVEMLGHDASFGHIHAVKMVHNRTLLEKRVGYLAVALTLHPDHSFMLLLINTIQTDLKSDNYLEVSMALTVVCKLVNSETMPALLPLVVKLLDHKEGNVKKKAVMALHRFHQIDPSSVTSLQPQVRKALCDSNISVMGCALCLFVDLCAEKPSLYKDLVPDFVSILKQVIEHRLPRDYDYHRMPAPWIQLKLLQILALLGNSDKGASEGMYEILHEVMKRADIGINVGYAIVYECVRTITSIYPNSALIEDAAMSIARFITSDNHNLKYLGVNSLASIVQIDSKYAAEHQMTVIDCLEDPDETLKRKTLDLLYSMTNPANVIVIVDKLTNYLRSTTDVYLRTELVSRINQLAEKYAPNNAWFIRTMNDVFELGGDLVRPEMALNLMRLISENAVDGAEDIRVYAADIYIGLMSRDPLPDILIQVIAWVLGEFGHMSRSISRVELITKLCILMERPYKDLSTRSWILTAVMKQVADMHELPKQVRDLAIRYQNSIFVDLQQRAHEFLELTKTPQVMRAVVPISSAAENVHVDNGLSFLNSYVAEAQKNGAKPYQARSLESHVVETKNESRPGLVFTPYANEPIYDNKPVAGSFPTHEIAPTNNTLDTGLRLSGVKRTWGPTGYVGDDHTTPTATPAPAPATAAYAATVAAPAATPAAQHQEPERPKQQKQPERRRSLTEKEKLATSLFAGIGASTATPAPAPARHTVTSSQRTTQPSQPSHAQPQQSHAPTTAPVVDLLSGLALETATRNATTVQPQASTGPLDLMGFADAIPVVTQQQSKPPSSNDSLFDIFGSSSQPSQPHQQQQQQQQQASFHDMFAFESKSNGHVTDKIGEAAIATSIQVKIGQFQRTPPQEIVVVNDQRVQLSYFKSYAPDSTYLVLFLSNKTTSLLSNISLTIATPSQALALTLESDPHTQFKQGSMITQYVLNWGSLQSKQTTTVLLGIQVRDLSLFRFSPLSLGLSLSFTGTSPIQSSLPFDILDLLRPAQMKTDQYGQNWKLFNEEQKLQIRPTTCTTATEFMSRASNIAHIFPVQTIGTENIVAGRLVGSGTGVVTQLTPAQHGLLCFIHGKVTTHIDLIVRTKNSEFTRELGKALQAIYK